MSPFLAHEAFEDIVQEEFEKLAVSQPWAALRAQRGAAQRLRHGGADVRDALTRKAENAAYMKDTGNLGGVIYPKGDSRRSLHNQGKVEAYGKGIEEALNKTSSVMAKIAESFERSGRRPISVDRLLERESEGAADAPASVMDKIANKKHLLSAAIGAGGFELARRANEDRKLGRAIRKQQQ